MAGSLATPPRRASISRRPCCARRAIPRPSWSISAGRWSRRWAGRTSSVPSRSPSARRSAAGPRAALGHIVEIVRGVIRDVDLLGRGDEDELILILPVSEIDDGLRVGERIRESLARRQPEGVEAADELRLTVSGGAVGFPDDGAT